MPADEQRRVDGMTRPVSSGMRYAPIERRARGAKGRPAMKKSSNVAIEGMQIFKQTSSRFVGSGRSDQPLLHE